MFNNLVSFWRSLIDIFCLDGSFGSFTFYKTYGDGIVSDAVFLSLSLEFSCRNSLLLSLWWLCPFSCSTRCIRLFTLLLEVFTNDGAMVC